MSKAYGTTGKQIVIIVDWMRTYPDSGLTTDIWATDGKHYELDRGSDDPAEGELVILERTESRFALWKVINPETE